MNTFLLVTETTKMRDGSIRTQENVSQYMAEEMADEFTADQIADLKEGLPVTKVSRFGNTLTFRDMIACTRIVAAR